MSNATNITNIAFYRFVEIHDPSSLRETLLSLCKELGLRGTILLATEGVNAMLAGEDTSIITFLTYLEADERFKSMLIKRSYSPTQPFKRLLVKVKNEILALREPRVNPTKLTGKYIKPQELREWFEKGEDFILLDTRNDFEVQRGTFKDAINPKTSSFGQFPKFVQNNLENLKNKKVVTFCTGGIRCEKATNLMLQAGLENVYQLEGGILEYFSQTDGKYFEGSCFVFDERVALNHALKPANS
jgi:UPF0176 protein